MRHELHIRSKLWPGEPGTKRYLATYGDRLVSVRYLYDAKRRLRFTTVELIVQEGPWIPRPRKPEALVGVQVQWGEARLAGKVKQAGGAWDSKAKIWRLAYAKAIALGLKDRLVPLPLQRAGRRPRASSAPAEVPPNG